MKLVALIILVVELLAAHSIQKPCSGNEFCVEMTKCPVYKNYSNAAFRDWPASVQSKAIAKLCNEETLNSTTVLSVCCPSVMNRKACGIFGEDRISNGDAAKPFQFPWMALLRNETHFVCGGTLISARYVLTAAHCTVNKNIVSVRLGENDINQDLDCIVLDDEKDCAPPPQNIAVEKIIQHRYGDWRENDIALLRLQEAAIFNHSVNTICLPDGTPGLREPLSYIVSGWGLTENGTSFDVLRYAFVPSVSLDRCQSINYFRLFQAGVELGKSHICAGGVDRIDSCSGDSGGPLQYISGRTSRFVQQGIVSFGIKSCGKRSLPGVYTNVAHFINWIFEHVDE